MMSDHSQQRDPHGNNIHRILSRTRSRISTIRSRTNATLQNESDDSDGSSQFNWKELPDYAALETPADGVNEERKKERKLGVTWNNLSIRGVAADACIEENTLSQFIPGRFKGSIRAGEKKLKTIVEQTSGCVQPGEMMLVLGRPGTLHENRLHAFS